MSKLWGYVGLSSRLFRITYSLLLDRILKNFTNNYCVLSDHKNKPNTVKKRQINLNNAHSLLQTSLKWNLLETSRKEHSERRLHLSEDTVGSSMLPTPHVPHKAHTPASLPNRKHHHPLQNTGQVRLAFAEHLPRARRVLGTLGKGKQTGAWSSQRGRESRGTTEHQMRLVSSVLGGRGGPCIVKSSWGLEDHKGREHCSLGH